MPGAQDTAQRLGGSKARLQRILVETVAEIAPGKPGVAAALERREPPLRGQCVMVEQRMGISDGLMQEAGLENIREARFLTIGVFAALKSQLSPGEADDVRAQLPRDLKEVWEDA